MVQRIRGVFLIVAGICGAIVAGAAEPAAERNAALAQWEALKYGMFIHFGMATFTGKEFDPRDTPATYAPTQLDVHQWVRTARQAGMKYAVLTAKHASGFCLWDSDDYDYDVAASGNKTDVVAEFMAACKAEGIKPGIYYSILDGHNEGGIRPQAPVGEAYFRLIKQQLRELHTGYPGIFEQWFDVPGKFSPAQRNELYQLVKKLSPGCLVVMSGGSRDGSTPNPASWPTDLLASERTTPTAAGHRPIKNVMGRTYYIPMETCDTLTANWFWRPNDPPRPVQSLLRAYSETVGRGANLLLNVPPDTTGRIPKEFVDRLMELKEVIGDRTKLPAPGSLAFGQRVRASGVWRDRPEFRAESAVDDDLSTRWAAPEGAQQAWLEVDLGKPVTFGRAMIAEASPNRVRSFELQYKEDDKWKTFLVGTTIGERWTEQFGPFTAQFVRLNIVRTTDSPTISEFQLYPPAKP